jgi:hypothetical protein
MFGVLLALSLGLRRRGGAVGWAASSAPGFVAAAGGTVLAGERAVCVDAVGGSGDRLAEGLSAGACERTLDERVSLVLALG